jgi:hypothetical protein
MSFHEDLSRTDDNNKQSSDRYFGLTFFVVLMILALWPLLGQKPLRPVALGVAIAFLVVAIVVPKWLAPLNRLWLKLGAMLQLLVSPIFLSVMFFGVITPVGLLRRLTSKDPLLMKFDRDCTSYWIKREPTGPQKHSLRRQF